MGSYANHRSSGGPSSGFRGRNFVVSSDMASVRSGWVGSGWGVSSLRREFRVRASKSRLRVARAIWTSDSDSVQNFGHYRLFPGPIWSMWSKMHAPTHLGTGFTH